MRAADVGTKTRRCMSAAVIVLVLAACSPSQPADGQDNPAAAASSAAAAAPAIAASAATPAHAALSDDEVVELVNAAVQKHKLTDVPEQCLSYTVEDNDDEAIDIEVREKHDEKCGGDPAVSPRLFSFKLDRSTRQLRTDAMDREDGDFQPID